MAEQRLRGLDVLVSDAAQLDVGADQRRVGRLGDDRVERRNVAEAVLGLLGRRDVAEPRPEPDADAPPIERREGVLEPDAELADDRLGVCQLLPVLVLGQVLVAEPAAEVADVPATVGVLADLGLGGAGQGGLVEGVRDQLPDRVGQSSSSRTRSMLRSNSRAGPKATSARARSRQRRRRHDSRHF